MIVNHIKMRDDGSWNKSFFVWLNEILSFWQKLVVVLFVFFGKIFSVRKKENDWSIMMMSLYKKFSTNNKYSYFGREKDLYILSSMCVFKWNFLHVYNNNLFCGIFAENLPHQITLHDKYDIYFFDNKFSEYSWKNNLMWIITVCEIALLLCHVYKLWPAG